MREYRYFIYTRRHGACTINSTDPDQSTGETPAAT